MRLHSMLNQTPFYAESGGQVGDTGLSDEDGLKIDINDTQKVLGDVHILLGTVAAGSLQLNALVHQQIDAGAATPFAPITQQPIYCMRRYAECWVTMSRRKVHWSMSIICASTFLIRTP